MSHIEDSWTVSHFTQSNPEGEGQGDLPALLRRVAGTIEGLGEIDILDVVFHNAVTADEDLITLTVYYHRKE
jgi:hypothetical protein